MQCKLAGIKRVSFTGGEPFLRPEFLNRISVLAVREEMLFGRIMTNGVWYKDVWDLKNVLTRLHKAGYDGDICVSVDAFHTQNIRKVAAFIKAAVSIWRRPDIVSIAWVGGVRDKETKVKLNKLLFSVKPLPIKTVRIPLSPVNETMSKLKSSWGDRWFKEDYCKGPGNALFVMPDGDVKPCCGYATDHAVLTIGNINRDSAVELINKARRNDFVRSVFTIGLSGIRKRLMKLGVRFPGKTENHCFFCNYILTKIPKKILKRAIATIIILAVLVIQQDADASVLKKSADYSGINVKITKRIPIPRWYHEGLLINGDSVWVANGRDGNVWVVDSVSGKITSEISPPAGFTEAIVKTKDNKYLVTDWDDKKLYETSLKDDKLIIERTLFDFSPSHPAGLVYTNDSLLAIVWTRGLGTKFEIIKLDKEFKLLERIEIKDIQEPAHMAWDGKYLWITGWYNRRVYKVDAGSWKMVASFRAPLNKVTGIVWDEKYLWVTGTYADLYQLSVD